MFDRVVAPGSSMFPRGIYILGHSAYPLFTWLMTPCRDNGHLSDKEHYNFLHSSIPMLIETAFALLKRRFHRFEYVDADRVEDIPDLVLAACTLHLFTFRI